jgi:hypothetical protein
VAAPLVADTVRGLVGLESVMYTTLSSLSVLSQSQVKGTLWVVTPGWKVTVPAVGVKPEGKGKAPESATKLTDTEELWWE